MLHARMNHLDDVCDILLMAQLQESHLQCVLATAKVT